MENIALRKRLSDFSSWGEGNIINPYSLLNLEVSARAIRPLRWVIGFIFLSLFFVAFSNAGPSYYPVILIRYLIFAFFWILLTCMVENILINHRVSAKNAQEDPSYTMSYKMFLKSGIIWTISLFLFITVFLLA